MQFPLLVRIPLPRAQGLVKGECLPATTTVLSHLALLVTGRISCGGETCPYSVQVGTGIILHKYCISLWLFCPVFVFSFIFCDVRSNTNITWLFVVLVCPCGDMQVSPMVVAQL